MKNVTGKETISDLLMGIPEAAEIMASFGLSCVSCGLNMYESLEDGVKLHGWKQKDLDDLLHELNEAIGEGAMANKSIQVTHAARDGVYELQQAEQMEGWGLRVEVDQTNGDEVSFFLDFEELPAPDDEVIRANGILVFAKPASAAFLRTAVIDYTDDSFIITPKE